MYIAQKNFHIHFGRSIDSVQFIECKELNKICSFNQIEEDTY